MKTTFADLKIGDKFILGGNDRRELRKSGTTTAVPVEASSLKGALASIITVTPTTEVVKEHGATVDDILGSWGKL